MRLWPLVVLAGCWGSTAPAPPPIVPAVESGAAISMRHKPRGPTHCERAIDHTLEIIGPELDRNQVFKDNLQALRDSAVEGCHATEWSDDALACFDGTADLASVEPCFRQLSDPQREDLQRRMTETLKQGP